LAPDFSPETIFISYSRSDGRVFAEAFERRLGEEAGIRSWRDLKNIEGGEDIRPQVLRAIALDAAVSALAVHNGNIALGDALGRVHVFEAEEFLGQKGNAS
jgi:hypothetical protein